MIATAGCGTVMGTRPAKARLVLRTGSSNRRVILLCDFDVFDKPSLSIDDQVERLIDRGLEADPERLRAVLARISYYRLSGYLWWWYEDDAVGERFPPGTTLDSVLDLYRFDAELRALVLLLAHDIEVWLRGALANQLAEHHGADGYVQPELYQNPAALEGDLEKLKGLFTRRSPELFVRAFRERYGEDAHPPIWMATEVMSLGLRTRCGREATGTVEGQRRRQPQSISKTSRWSTAAAGSGPPSG